MTVIGLDKDVDIGFDYPQYFDEYVRDRPGDNILDAMTTRAAFCVGGDGDYLVTLTGGVDQPITAYAGTRPIKYIELYAPIGNAAAVMVGHAIARNHELMPGQWYKREMTNPVNLQLAGAANDTVSIRLVGFVGDEDYTCPAKNILDEIVMPT